MALQDSGIFIASSLIADTPEKDKENAEPIASRQRSGDGPSRYDIVGEDVVAFL